ncbi:pyridoxal phosphate-dependent decarboxylase family protein [Gloeobacter kilaueensis]|uniref:Pyridoxal-dependent decarboxylase n=1 Tax=Gloeobacter kilaueensis (strain ATCC BAA-2537 / CCAP 1431/1 / ULC 316 / JS1) TaxID=1183438 RepID=U5QJN5_GLOK1|nr:pyridoxal-dependent decarboxylase [Gloeobacter kilaueensis]AGY59207.1 pyridoxal-dependent decarboxylase [Gloeobacter kilaueensis JS1]
MEAEEFRRLGYRLVDMAADYLERLPGGPVFQPMPDEARQTLLNQPLPEAGLAADRILDRLADTVLPYPMGNGHPRFFGWVNSPPEPLAALTELLAATMNPSCAGGDHAAIYLEHCAVRWLMELVGYPTARSGGLLVSGGSMASLTCLAAARHWAATTNGWDVRSQGLSSDHPPLVLYVSEEGHSCLRKAAELLGLGNRQVRTVPVDDRYRLMVPALAEAVARDRSAGYQPFCVVGSAGTVNTGAIDPLSQLADFCGSENLWLHVDGAYGAVGILDTRIEACYQGLGRAHSLALDPHKWLAVPVECGCALVREGELLRDAFALVPAYLRTEEGKGFGGLPWFSEYGFQQTRGFRALKLWTTLLYKGRDGLAATVARHNTLACLLARLIEQAENLELLAPVQLSIVCFRFVPAALKDVPEQLENLNRQIVLQIQAGGRAFLSSTTLQGRFALRACILHPQTSEADLTELISLVRAVGEQLVAAADS